MIYTPEKCEGCEKHCTFNAIPAKNEYSAGLYNTYYLPALDDTIIAGYCDNSGKTKKTRMCETAQEARKLAEHIYMFCCYHKQNAK